QILADSYVHERNASSYAATGPRIKGTGRGPEARRRRVCRADARVESSDDPRFNRLHTPKDSRMESDIALPIHDRAAFLKATGEGTHLMHPLRRLREAGPPTPEQAAAILAENVVMHSPVLIKPIIGRELVAITLSNSSHSRDDPGKYVFEGKFD